MTSPRVLLVALGGTITMTASGSGGIVPTLSGSDLLNSVPGIAAIASVETASPLLKPGPSLSIEDVLSVATYLKDRLSKDFDGAVVVQGTDTIEETAFLLDCTVGGEKPVVVTGAMRGPEAAGADGPGNILAAITVAASPKARARGALVVLNDEIHAARFVSKTHTSLPSAFRSAPVGPIGLVAEGSASFYVGPDGPLFNFAIPDTRTESVALHRISMGEDARLLNALPDLGFSGVILEAMGAGHVPAPLVDAISSLCARMPVVLTSRTGAGPIYRKTYGFPGSEMDLIARGVIPGGILSGVKARLLLTLLLRSDHSGKSVADAFSQFS